MERGGGERRGGMLSDVTSREGRKIELKINILITKDILPPPPPLRPPHSIRYPYVGIDGGMILGGGGPCFGGAVETAARTMEKFNGQNSRWQWMKLKASKQQ